MAELVYNKDGRLLFTKEMKKEYTLLMPQMLPIPFELFRQLLPLCFFRHSNYLPIFSAAGNTERNPVSAARFNI